MSPEVAINPNSSNPVKVFIWTMDDNGTEVMEAVERWLQSDDYDRVKTALSVSDAFPFEQPERMVEVFRTIKARWPELAARCAEIERDRNGAT